MMDLLSIGHCEIINLLKEEKCKRVEGSRGYKVKGMGKL